MGKIIVEAEVSIDGIMNGEGFWEEVFKYHSNDVTAYLDNLLRMPNALIMGRMTYEAFAEVWPTREGEMADIINRMPKYVVSRTLDNDLKWNTTLINDDVVGKLKKLKSEGSNILLQYGIGELTRTMIEHNLVDEMHLIMFPFTFGNGLRIFESVETNSFKLIDTETFDSGAILLKYQPLGNQGN